MFTRLTSMFQFAVSNPLGFLVYFINFSLALILTLVMHEFAHAYIALKCGDSTAKLMGRLSLNPLKHLDPLGTVFMVVLGFGWAKPVPIDPRNFKNRVQDEVLVSFAGIIMNLTLFLLSVGLMIFINRFVWVSAVYEHYSSLELINFNHIGYNFLIGNTSLNLPVINNIFFANIQRFLMIFAQFNLMIAIFNFLPIPPLDGYHIFNLLLFKGRLKMNYNTIQLLNIAVFILFLTGSLGKFIFNIANVISTGTMTTLLKLTGGL